ncbi:nitroreductase family protein [Candidatus Neomarinimicrobiota bacterium]
MNNIQFNNNIINLIKSRSSWRSYISKQLEENELTAINILHTELTNGPLGSSARFQLINKTSALKIDNRRLGTYGFIKNPRYFIAGAVKRGEYHWEDYGYLMELIILKMTDMELGTCWLGGTFSRSAFGKIMQIRNDEVIPAVTSVGNISETRSIRDHVIRWGAKSHSRKSINNLFFENNFNRPINLQTLDFYSDVLEMVRLAPSASNRQPWRIVKIYDNYHLFLKRSSKYASYNNSIDLQRVDMGIAMCHFELTANALGLKGYWKVNRPDLTPPDSIEYIVTWESIN